MKEATGEVSMTIVTLVAIAVIGGILAANWNNIRQYINRLWNPAQNGQQCEEQGGTWNGTRCSF